MKNIVFILFYCFLLSVVSYSQVLDPKDSIEYWISCYEYEKAINQANKILDKGITGADIYYNLGRAYLALYKLDSSEVALQKAFSIDTINVKILNIIGILYNKMELPEKAIQYYNKILNLDSANNYAFIQLAALYVKTKNYRKAMLMYDCLIENDSINTYFVKQKGNCYIKLDSIDRAIICLKKVYMLNKYDLSNVAKLANLYIRKKDFTNGLEITGESLGIDSTNITILKLFGYLNFLTEKDYKCISSMKSARSYGDSSRFVYKYIGLSYYRLEEYIEARNNLRIVFLKDTTDLEMCYYFGISCGRSFFQKDAIYYLNKVLKEITPSDKYVASIYKELAVSYKKINEHDKALDYFFNAYKHTPGDKLLVFQIASQFEFGVKDKRMALLYYEKFMDTREENIATQKPECMTVSYYEYAKQRIIKLKEDLFFED